jgi:hypothetical protein
MVVEYGREYLQHYDQALAERGSLRLVLGDWYANTRKKLARGNDRHR